MGQVVSMLEMVEERKRQEEEKHGKGNGGSGGISSEFIAKCLNENELGDGNLFKRIYRDRFVFNNAMNTWMSWAGHHWKVDVMKEVRAGVSNEVANTYLEEAKMVSAKIRELEDGDPEIRRLEGYRKQLIQRASALRATKRRMNCLEFAHASDDPLAITGDDVDNKPWLLPCTNGVINLRTGELEEGRQGDMLLKSSPVEWQGIDAPCEVWEKALLEIFSDNQVLVDFFQRVCGYALVGQVVQSVMVVLTGRGRNGKSMIVETISEAMGQLAGAIRSEMLLDQYRVASSSGPTPDIMKLRGIRMAFGSETDDGCRISPSKVKWLTGNDTITGRSPHDKYEVQFKPSHTLFLLTNYKPYAPSEDFAFWERMILIPFNLSFVDREPRNDMERRADPLLPQKLKEELPGILAWMVRGCLLWQDIGLRPPTIIKEAVSEYQRDGDFISDFIDECCYVDAELSVGATAVYEVFDKWWTKNVSNKPPKQKRFGSLFSKRFERRKEGTMKYFGVGLAITLDH